MHEYVLLGIRCKSTLNSGFRGDLSDYGLNIISPSFENDTFLSGGVIKKRAKHGISLKCCWSVRMSSGTLFMLWVYKMKPRFFSQRCKWNYSHVEAWPAQVKLSILLASSCVLLFSVSAFFSTVKSSGIGKKWHFQFNSSRVGISCLTINSPKNQSSQIGVSSNMQWMHQCISCACFAFWLAACLYYIKEVMCTLFVVTTTHLLIVKTCQTQRWAESLT